MKPHANYYLALSVARCTCVHYMPTLSDLLRLGPEKVGPPQVGLDRSVEPLNTAAAAVRAAVSSCGLCRINMFHRPAETLKLAWNLVLFCDD